MTEHNPIAKYAQTPALRMHYTEWSPQGTPILLLHGLSSTLHIWDLVAPTLTDMGRVIALDQRGHGLTTQPDEGYDLDTSSDDVLAFTQAIGIRKPFWLIGHSWGAGVALNTATRHPDQVRGLVLVDGAAMDIKYWLPTWAEAEARLTPPSLSHFSLEELRTGMREHWLQPAWSPEVEAAALHGFGEDEHGKVQRRLTLKNHMQIAHSLWQFTPAEHFPRVTCPTLICPARGSDPERDGMRTEQINLAASQLAHVRCAVQWFDNTIHDIPWHRPAELAAAIKIFIRN